MWLILGFVIASAIGLSAALVSGRRGSTDRQSFPWELGDTAKLHVAIIGNLAGFAFTGVVLVVTLAQRTSAFQSSLDNVVVMFSVAYLFWVGSAFLISFLPHSGASGDFVPRVHFSLATTIEFRTVFLSWFALLPLLEANGLGRLTPVLAFLLPTSLIPGSILVAMVTDSLGQMRVNETVFSAIVSAVLALAYTVIVSFLLPDARSAYSPLQMALVIFCLNSAGFALAALTPLSPRYAGLNRFYEQYGRRIVIADMQLTMLSLIFLWLAVVKKI
jgi:hypothetical protein